MPLARCVRSRSFQIKAQWWNFDGICSSFKIKTLCKIGFIWPKSYPGREYGKKFLTLLEHCVLTFLWETFSLLHLESLSILIFKVAFALDSILKGYIFKCHNLTKVHEELHELNKTFWPASNTFFVFDFPSWRISKVSSFVPNENKFQSLVILG